MPGLQCNSGAESHDQAMIEALDLFCNSTEQSYEQFLSTFTYLPPDNVSGGCLDVLGAANSTSSEMMDRRERRNVDREVDAVHERASLPSRGQHSQCAPTTDVEELVLDGSVTVGRLVDGETLPSDQPVKFDNYLDDVRDEEEALHAAQDVCVLPGEIEEDLPVYTPSFCHHTLLELSSTDMDHKTHTPQSATECQNEIEEVVPFTLDDTFDYDHVVLSHKHPIQGGTRAPS